MSVISQEFFVTYFGNLSIKPCTQRLVVIDVNGLKVLGKVEVTAQLGSKRQKLNLVVLKCQNDFTPLIPSRWKNLMNSKFSYD